MYMRHLNRTQQWALIADLTATFGSLLMAHWLRNALLEVVPFGGKTSFASYNGLPLMVVVLWGILFYVQGAYSSERFKSLSAQYWMVFKTTFFGTALILAVLFGLKMALPRTLLGLFAVVSLLALMAEKAAVHYGIEGLRKRGYNRKSLLVIGAGDKARRFVESVREYSDWGLDLVGFIDKERVGETYCGAKILGTPDRLREIRHEHVVNEVVMALPVEALSEVQETITVCEELGIPVRVISEFFTTKIAKACADEIHGFPMLSFEPTP